MAHSEKALYAVVLLSVLFISSERASASLCAYNLSTRWGRFVSSRINSNVKEVPKIYENIVNTETDCIIFGKVNWNEDAIMLFSTSSFLYFSSVEVIMNVEGNSQVSQTRRTLLIVRSATQRFPGNMTSDFAIVYKKKSPTFSLTYLAVWHRISLCPNPRNDFDVVSCTRWTHISSNCTLQCKKGFFPSPDLYDPNILPVSFRTFQSKLPQFTSVCSYSERNRPAWKPDVLSKTNAAFGVEWTEYPHYWRCISMNEVRDICLSGKTVSVSYKGIFKTHVNTYYGRRNCYYPNDYLLSIFNENTTQRPTTTTTTKTTTTTTRTTTIALASTNFPQPSTLPNVIPSVVPNVAPTEEVNTCTQYCQLSSVTNSYYPLCGSYPTSDEQLACLTCRYTSGCVQQLSAVG